MTAEADDMVKPVQLFVARCAFVATLVYIAVCLPTVASTAQGKVEAPVETQPAVDNSGKVDANDRYKEIDIAAEPDRIRIYFMLDPQLTRGLQMGDQWSTQRRFTSVRQIGRIGSLRVRAAGVDDRGRLMYQRLEVEWQAADPDVVQISPVRGTEATIRMTSPGRSKLYVVRGDVSTTLILEAIYDEEIDRTQLVIQQAYSE